MAASSALFSAMPSATAAATAMRSTKRSASAARRPSRSLTIRAANTPADAAADFAAAGSEVTVKRHDLGDCKVRLEVTVPVSVQERAYTACIEGFAEKAQIPGFTYKKGGSRKKKSDHLPPASVLINFVGEKEFKSACVEEMLQNSIPAAMQTVAAAALQDSERIETAFDELAKAFSGQDCAPVGEVIYDISVEVVPTINWTGDYRKLKVTVTAPGDDETDALEAESLFKQQLRSLGTMRVVTSRGLEVGDQVVMDLDAVNADSGDTIEGGDRSSLLWG